LPLLEAFMADNLGRINPVSQHFLNRGVREEPYQGRHSKKHTGAGQESVQEEREDADGEGNGESAVAMHIDLRI
jgi:hypothetical protein